MRMVIGLPACKVRRRPGKARLEADGRKPAFPFSGPILAQSFSEGRGKMVRASSFALAFVLLFLAAGSARAELLYTSSFCGGAYAPCDFTPRTAGPSAAAPLTSQSFVDYFVSRGYKFPNDPDPGFIFGPIDRNADFEIGYVYGSGQIHTVYIDGVDGLICCTIDEPYRLTGINDNNLLIGQDGD